MGSYFGVFDVELDRDGFLHDYRRISPDNLPRTKARGKLWYAYLEVTTEQSWFDNQTYVDTLNPDATRRFIEITHQEYAKSLRKDFGRTLPAIFTDEPQFTHKQYFQEPFEERDLILPFTDDLPKTFLKEYGTRLGDRLPEIFWELPRAKCSVTRYRYHDHLAARFASAYADVIRKWCRENGIAMTGHMMEEPTLASQTGVLGEAMRSLRSFDIPGIDILCDHHPETNGQPVEFTTAKQAQSAARQYGRDGVMSELYSVTNWDFTFAGHKAQGDWQAALGVSVRMHHLSLVTLEGEAKRDFPASIFYQSPWYKEYKLIEDHFAGVNVAMTRGKPCVKVGVIHRVESYWTCFGPMSQTKDERADRDKEFAHLTKWLVHGLIDFDFISESLLPSQCALRKASKLQVGKMSYETVLVPGMRTIRSTTLDRLQAYANGGGTVIFAGEIPSLVDAVESDRARILAANCVRIDFSKIKIMQRLEPIREIGVYGPDGALVNEFACQISESGQDRFIFICYTNRGLAMDGNPSGVSTTVRIKGIWKVEVLDTFTGETRLLPATDKDGCTSVEHHSHPVGSLLLRLSHSKPVKVTPPKSSVFSPVWIEGVRLESPMKISLSEPNVLLLDQPFWRVGTERWRPRDWSIPHRKLVSLQTCL